MKCCWFFGNWFNPKGAKDFGEKCAVNRINVKEKMAAARSFHEIDSSVQQFQFL